LLVVEHEPDVAQPPDARLRADRRQAHLDAREAERALLGLARAVVEVDLLVRAPRDALAPAPALVLVHEHDAVLLALVDRARGARGGARGVEAVLADARQVEHEGLLEHELDLVGGLAQHGVVLEQLGAAREVVVPVRAPADLHVLAADERLGPGDGHVLLLRRRREVLVVVRPRLVVVVDRRHLRAREDRQEVLEPTARLELQATARVERPATLPAFLVLVGAWVALTGPGLAVVDPHVLGPGAVRPRLLARDRARVAPDALVEVHDHRHLCHDAHQYSTSWLRRRIWVTSSRWFPVGPR